MGRGVYRAFTIFRKLRTNLRSNKEGESMGVNSRQPGARSAVSNKRFAIIHVWTPSKILQVGGII
jgi:hypothetical protein